MSVVDRLKGLVPGQRDPRADVAVLARRVDALRRFIRASEGYVPEPTLVAARTVVDRAGERLALSSSHTVVALAGATGSGKSTIFNALGGFQLSRVGVRRPTTAVAHACIWGASGAEPLLDWLSVPPQHRFSRESALDGNDEAALRGLVLIDLPDFDSVEVGHRVEVDRLLRLVDLVVWVMDPQKYADKLVHETYLRQFSEHRDITVVLLHQADRLSRADSERCVADLRILLEHDGLPGVPCFATSAKGQPGLDALRILLSQTVTKRESALRRMTGDVATAVTDLRPLVVKSPVDERVEPAVATRLTDALAAAAGVPIVADASERTYKHRAAQRMGWPVVRWLGRFRPDPLKRLHLGTAPRGVLAATSLPEATAAQRAAVGLAARAVADHAGADLPAPWPDAVVEASRSRLADVPDALDTAIAGSQLGLDEPPTWWKVVGVVQWIAAAVAYAGLAWLVVRYALLFLGLPDMRGPLVGWLPLPTALLIGGLLAGLLIGVVVRPFVASGARRARKRTARRLRAAVAQVAADHVIGPIVDVRHAYGVARGALDAAD
jgi:GTP-binding protein EngB required for normal cell division